MKKVIIGVAVAGLLVVLVGLTVVFFSLDSLVKKGVETVGPELTKVEVRLGGVSLSPFSGKGQLKQLFIGNPTGFKTPSAIQMGEVKVGVQVASLTADTVVIDELTIQAPEITLEGTLNGDNNLSKILANLNASMGGAPKSKTDAPAAQGKEKKFAVKELTIEGGKVNLSLNLPILGGKSATVPLPPIHLQNIGTADNGVTAAELATKIMGPLMSGVTDSATKYVTDLTKNLTNVGKQGIDELKKAAGGLGGLGDLLKKK